MAKATAQYTIVNVDDGSNAVQAFLTNENHTLTSDSSGQIISYAGASTAMYVFDGATDVTSQYTFTKIDSTGVTSSISGNTVTVSAISNGIGGTITITATRGTSSISKVFTLSVSKQGAAGKGISSVDEYYLASTKDSGVTTSDPGWSTTIPSISGDPVPKTKTNTIISVDDAIYDTPNELKLISPESTQFTTTGKNLGANNIQSQTKGDLTITTYNDGTMKITGIDSGNQYITGTENNITLEAGTYILNGCPNGGSASTYDLYLEGISGTNDFGSGSTFTISETTNTKYVFRVRANTQVDIIVKPMIRLSSISDDTFEPYTGGIPSPNPDYPQEIVTEKGLSNLLDDTYLQPNTSASTLNGGTYTYENGLLVVDGTNATDWVTVRSVNKAASSTFILEPGTYYTDVQLNVRRISDNYSYQIQRKFFKITSSVRVMQWFTTCAQGDIRQFHLLICKSVYTQIPYVPCGNNYMLFRRNKKNLLNYKVSSILRFPVDANDNITCSTPTTDNRSWSFANCNWFANLVAGTYTFTVWFSTQTSNSSANMNIRLEDDTLIYTRSMRNVDTFTKTFTLTEAHTVGFETKIYEGVCKVQLEDGPTSTEFEPYSEENYLIPLNGNELAGKGTNLDELIIDKLGHCYVNKKMNKVILDGTEEINKITDGYAQLGYYFKIPIDKNYLYNVNAQNYTMCSNFKVVKNAVSNLKDGTITFSSSKNKVAVGFDGTVSDLSTYLTNNNTTIIYPLETPQLIDLNCTVDLRLFEGYNNILNSSNADMVLNYNSFPVKYLWNYALTTYTDSSTNTTTPVIVGTAGDSGKGIRDIETQYYLSSSSTELTGGSWSSEVPTWEQGKYLWTRTVTLYSDFSTHTSEPTCVTGSTGATGTGITSITEQYYLSTSKTTQTGGSWVTTPPTWSVGKYIWTRSEIVYSNPTSTVYTTPLCSSEWEAVNEIQIGGRNLLLKTSDTESSLTVAYKDIYSLSNYAKQFVKSTDTLTVSFEARGSVDMYFDMYWRDSSTSYNNTSSFYPSFQSTTSYQKYTYTGLAGRDLTNMKYLRLRQNSSSHGSGTIVGTLYFKNFKLELGNKNTTWTPAPEDIDSDFSDMTTYVNGIRDNLQNQIDGAIQFWNGPDIPTLNNYPANQWTTDADKTNHIADIYTVIQDVQGELKQGKGYRFDKVNNQWVWVEITDNELSAVQALAASKAKVYVVQPTVPYNIGDLWLNNGDLYRCKTAKDSSGSFALADWELATDYTDNSYAQQVQQNLDNLQIGGRNYLLKSMEEKNATRSSGNVFIDIPFSDLLPTLSDTTFTVSFLAKAGSGASNLTIVFYLKSSSETLTVTYTPDVLTSDYTRYTHTFNMSVGKNLADVEYCRFNVNGGTGTAYIKEYKLEVGEKATSWSPAPEDAIESLDVEYYLSDSSVSPTGGSWSTTAPAWVDGKYMWSRQKLTYGNGTIEYKNQTCIAGATGATGATGADAKLVTINPSSQFFKSTAGASGTFTPQYIYLYPSFQSVTYSKWQYSTDGITWTDVTSGQNGLTISTYNSVANTLRIQNTSALYTSSITAVSFKCVSSDAGYYDTVTVIKVYDVTDIEVGGTNLLENSSANTGNLNHWSSKNYMTYHSDGGLMDKSYFNVTIDLSASSTRLFINNDSIKDKIEKETTYTVSGYYRNNNNDVSDIQVGVRETSQGTWAVSIWTIHCEADGEWHRFEATGVSHDLTYTSPYPLFQIAFQSGQTHDIDFCLLKLEKGNVPSDWSPAPEDAYDFYIYTSPTAPATPFDGQVWMDTNSGTTYVYDETNDRWKTTDLSNLVSKDELSTSLANKSRIYITRPTPPYNAGDMWIVDDSTDPDNGKIKTCLSSRATGSFVASDWYVPLTAYTTLTQMTNVLGTDPSEWSSESKSIITLINEGNNAIESISEQTSKLAVRASDIEMSFSITGTMNFLGNSSGQNGLDLWNIPTTYASSFTTASSNEAEDVRNQLVSGNSFRFDWGSFYLSTFSEDDISFTSNAFIPPTSDQYVVSLKLKNQSKYSYIKLKVVSYSNPEATTILGTDTLVIPYAQNLSGLFYIEHIILDKTKYASAVARIKIIVTFNKPPIVTESELPTLNRTYMGKVVNVSTDYYYGASAYTKINVIESETVQTNLQPDQVWKCKMNIMTISGSGYEYVAGYYYRKDDNGDLVPITDSYAITMLDSDNYYERIPTEFEDVTSKISNSELNPEPGLIYFGDIMVNGGLMVQTWTPRQDENLWGDKIKFSSNGISIEDRSRGYKRVLDESSDIAWRIDENGNIVSCIWKITQDGFITKNIKCYGTFSMGYVSNESSTSLDTDFHTISTLKRNADNTGIDEYIYS